MFKQTLQQQQQFRDSIYIKCRYKGYYTKNCKDSQQNYTVKGISISRNNKQVKATRECLINYFAFYYNSTYKVYKDTKYSTGQWLQKPELDYAKAIRELENK